ncbi:hypothetical protein D3C86_2093400 [compost metagenome]
MRDPAIWLSQHQPDTEGAEMNSVGFITRKAAQEFADCMPSDLYGVLVERDPDGIYRVKYWRIY